MPDSNVNRSAVPEQPTGAVMPEIIEKLKQVDRQLSDPEIDPELATALFENSPDAIVITDSAGTIRLINQQAELLFRYHRSELIGRAVEVLLPQDVHEKHVAHRAGFIADPRIRPMGLGRVLHGMAKDGIEFEAEINLSPIITRHGFFVAANIRKKR